jgi:hypothetical protein
MHSGKVAISATEKNWGKEAEEKKLEDWRKNLEL